MLTTGERQELLRVEQELRESGRGFAWRLTMLQGMLPTFAGGAVLTEPAALMALGDAAWPDWESGQEPDHASPAPGWPQPGSTDPR
jgi:hypothetical protein